ncbi:hypothetical protein [Labilibaculum euxinus]
MKKLLLSLMICLGIMMISSQTFAQNNPGEKLKPYVGGTYTYTFDGITDGLTYEFYISSLSTSGGGKGTVDTGLTGYITSGLTGTVSGNKAVATIAWPAATTTGTEVYLFVKISGAGVCENYNAVGITPIANSFTLALIDDIASPSCPDLTGLNAVVAPTDTYNAGTTTLTYTFTKAGNDNDWNAGFDIVQVGSGDYTYTFNGTSASVTGNNATTAVSATGLTNNTQVVTIVVNNVPGETPSFKIHPTSAVDVVTSVSPTLPGDVTHIITPMPVIGSFN